MARRGHTRTSNLRSKWALSCLLLAACAPDHQIHDSHDPSVVPPVDEFGFRCAREPMPANSPYRMPLAREELDPTLAAHLAVLPPRARRTALAAGLEPLLARILQARSTSTEPQLELIEREHELELRLNALSAQVSAVEFEARCTSEMLGKVQANFLEREQARQVKLATLSLMVGAALATAAGVWALADDDSHAPVILGIAGGGIAAGLGGFALVHEAHPIRVVHQPNRLTPIERGVDPEHLYPTFVFRMLTFPQPSQAQSPRDELIASWKRELEEALPRSETVEAAELLNGPGGKYEDIRLALRARRFQDLELAVLSIARDLELLDRSLVRIFTMPGSAPAKPQP
ncbi:MAG TPA: hypothetical protein VER96_37730 [Polyangiaceae bacterium]|nr:hypothetical protein [Polyangiaceae bacterium]